MGYFLQFVDQVLTKRQSLGSVFLYFHFEVITESLSLGYVYSIGTFKMKNFFGDTIRDITSSPNFCVWSNLKFKSA
jgi:hypothetical protein